MSSRPSRIVEAVLGRLRTIPTLGEDGVVLGWPTPGEVRAPCLWVRAGGFRSSRESSTIEFRREMTIDVIGYVGGEGAPLGDPALGAAELGDQVAAVLEVDPQLGEEQLVLDCAWSCDTLGGDELGIGGQIGAMVGQVSVYWLVQQGEGS